MIRASLLFTTALSALPLAPAFAQDGKDVTIVLGEDIDLVEPCMATRSNIGRIIMQNVNETLTQYDVKGGQGVIPRLAESWEDQGNGTWRFNLRQGVTFSDGSAFDANDVKHSFERAMSDQLTCETPRYFGDTKLTFTVVDDHTIDVTADPAQPILPLLLVARHHRAVRDAGRVRARSDRHRAVQARRVEPGPEHHARAPRRLLGRGAGGRRRRPTSSAPTRPSPPRW